ncbi:transglycosylase family protein [Streptacidiphilus cavernicola]|uniref:Transglycosylase family protein n=1 Tax=Streptacidiphilus cavernicola TaxID=3342716 RepID=A0ABV6VWV4_9ACTN
MNLRTATTAVRTVTTGRNRMRAALVTGVLVATPVAGLVTATAASASDSSSTWDKVASCESTNNWSADTGNGFSGGLQFTPSTWAAYGGTQYAANAADASKAQQIAVAQNVLADQGPGAWPVCGPEAGLTASSGGASSGSSDTSSSDAGSSSSSASTSSTDSSSSSYSSGSNSSGSDSSSSSSSASSSTPALTGGHSSGTQYTVKSGDTLGAIAAAHGTNWQHLFAANQFSIGNNADAIYPGQILVIG